MAVWPGLLVALRKESVDRNYKERPGQKARPVALRKESVDRNIELSPWGGWGARSLSARRAWIEIGLNFARKIRCVASLSARRAWIEIDTLSALAPEENVALRKESVDRNLWWGVRKAVGSLSLSARRAWIEI